MLKTPVTVIVLLAAGSIVKVFALPGACSSHPALSAATLKKPVADPSSSISIPDPPPEAAPAPSFNVISLSSTSKFAVLTVVVVPLTVKFPPTTRFPETSAAPLISILVAVRSISEPEAERSKLPLLEIVKLVPSPEINSALSPNASLSPDDTRAVPFELL